MNPKKRRFLLRPILSLLIFTPTLISQGQDPQKVEDLISLIKQKSGLEVRLDDLGWQWKMENVKGTPQSGEATFFDQKWLMYLIHWGPIQRKEITVDYVKERLLNMWGVKFGFSGKEGNLKIAGHDAVFVEAFGTNRSFYTRFIIWNCQDSGREFIADTNFNVKFKTPEVDFEAELRSAKTVQCHEGARAEKFPDLTKKISSERYGFSFDYPDRWFMFDSPFYVPFPEYEGIRDQKMGSLLGLPSDQNITVTLRWSPPENESEGMVMGIEQKTRESLVKEVKSLPGIAAVNNLGFESFMVAGKKIDRIWGTINVKNLNEKENEFFAEEGIYQAARWSLENKDITAIIKTRKFRYLGVESVPDRRWQDIFLRDFINKIG
jgi:hypothetical protein